jgi:hypothetical protein
MSNEQLRIHIFLTKPNNQGLLVKLRKMPVASSGGTNAIEVTRAEKGSFGKIIFERQQCVLIVEAGGHQLV